MTEYGRIHTDGSRSGGQPVIKTQHCPNCEAQAAEIERLREHLISALDTLKDAEVCDDNCGPCNEARAALGESK